MWRKWNAFQPFRSRHSVAYTQRMPVLPLRSILLVIAIIRIMPASCGISTTKQRQSAGISLPKCILANSQQFESRKWAIVFAMSSVWGLMVALSFHSVAPFPTFTILNCKAKLRFRMHLKDLQLTWFTQKNPLNVFIVSAIIWIIVCD